MESKNDDEINLILLQCEDLLNNLLKELINPILNNEIEIKLNQEGNIFENTLDRCEYKIYNELKNNIKYTATDDNIVYTCLYNSLSNEILKEIINIINKSINSNNLRP